MFVTRELFDASRAVNAPGAFAGIRDTQLELAEDCQHRARELLGMRVGAELKPWQVEYLQCLRQRLQAFPTVPAAKAWEAAFCAAYAVQSAA